MKSPLLKLPLTSFRGMLGPWPAPVTLGLYSHSQHCLRHPLLTAATSPLEMLHRDVFKNPLL